MLEKGFDMKKLLEKRLLEIDNLEEREQIRNMLMDIFRELSDYTSIQYQQLEERLLSQIYDTTNDYPVITGIIEKDLYDPSQECLHPIIPEDLEGKEINLEELQLTLSAGERFNVHTVYFDTDYITINRIANLKGMFYATIYTTEGKYQADIILEPTRRYEEKVNQLYEIYLLNGIPWRPLCTPYIYKMYDIYICHLDLPKDVQIEQVDFYFGEYGKYVKYNMLPLWNFEKIQLAADIRPEPCDDKIHYVHYMNNRRLKEDKKYLVADTDGSVIDILQKNGLGIISIQKEPRRWNLYQITNKILQKTKYPIFHNYSENKGKVNNRTKGGVFRFVNGLQYSEYIKLKNITFPQQRRDKLQIYPKDDFIQYESLNVDLRTNMHLEFEALKQDTYTYDILSYVINAVQYEYREFYCTAEID